MTNPNINNVETAKLFGNYMKAKFGDSYAAMFSNEALDSYYDVWLSGFYTGVRIARNEVPEEKQNEG